MSDSFFTIRQNGESLFRDRGSKFIGIARKVVTESEAENIIQELKREYHDARHHCFAWVLGEDHSSERSNDDGEPGHSAGDPILGQIRSRKLTQVIVVVIRYFGGTKLGVPGLINAYKTAASDALEASGIVKLYRTVSFSIEYSYDNTAVVMKMITERDLSILSQDFGLSCKLSFQVRLSLESEMEMMLREYSERSILLNYHKIS